ncbi:MAG TPA: ABC transporter permease [Acidimicrobiales bacterium]|nr:ABC transporter permease [Acidimicrobiales bacterium]
MGWLSNFLNYAIPGVPQGCEYGLMAVGLVLTFRATGVFNLGFAAQAFVSAFAYDLLNQYQGWPQWAAFIVAVLIVSPGIGLALDRFLYRHIPTASTTAKVLSSLGVLIAVPLLIPIIFGPSTRNQIAWVWLNPQTVYATLYHTPLNGTAVATTVITVGVVLGLIALFRFTSVGLQMRAVVESRRLAQLEGVNSAGVAATAWALSSALAGLAGVLMLPQQQTLDPTSVVSFTTLLVTGLTAAALASFRSIPKALIWSIVLGIAQNLLVWVLPQGSILQTGIAPALPFAVLVIVLLANPRLRSLEQSTDPLASVDPPPPPPSIQVRDRRLDIPTKWGWRLLLVGFVVSSLTWLPDNWVFPFSLGMSLSIVFLSITLITGMAGQLSLCQATFAGVGGFTAGQLATHFGMPVLVGALLGGLLAAFVGVLVALPALRLSGLPLTLVTLAFAIFADQVLFQYNWSGGGDTGVNVPRPSSLFGINFGVPGGDSHYLILLMIILALCMGIVALVQRGSVGRYLAAMRGSQVGAASLGISLTRAKVTIFALSAGMAGLGGALFASVQTTVSASDFNYVLCLAYVVAVITTGVTTVEGAVQAGVGLAVIQQVLNYLPSRLNGIEFVLFAFGTITYAAHPEGVLEYQKTRWMNRVAKLFAAYDQRHGRAVSQTAEVRASGLAAADLSATDLSATAAPATPGTASG